MDINQPTFKACSGTAAQVYPLQALWKGMLESWLLSQFSLIESEKFDLNLTFILVKSLRRSLIYLDVNQAVCCVESLYELQALKYVMGLGKILFQSIHFSC